MEIRKKTSFKFRLAEFLLIFFLITSSVTLSFSSGSFILNFKEIGFSIFSTAERGIFFVASGVKNSFSAIRELAELKKKYNALQTKLENYEQMQRSNVEIKKENEELKAQLGFVKTLSQKNHPAQIIARDIDPLYASLTIDKGSSAGIAKNMPVIAFQAGSIGLVGKVVSVGKWTSNIMPVYSVDYTVSARIQTTRDLGLVSGMSGSEKKLSMKYIKKRTLENLHFGDVIVTSGENGNYMRDMPIGTISEIRTIDYDSSLDIDLLPIIDFSKLETVIVIDQKSLLDEALR